MIAYPDTSFLCAMYQSQTHTLEAARHFAGMREPLHIASPLLLEFRQATRWQVYLNSKDSSKGFDRAKAFAALAKLQANLSGGFVVIVPVNWAEVADLAEQISARRTWTEGCKILDIIHVATARHLGAAEFLTFDQKQRRLAEAEGLASPL